MVDVKHVKLDHLQSAQHHWLLTGLCGVRRAEESGQE